MSRYIQKNTKAAKAQFLKDLFLGKAKIADAPISRSLDDADIWIGNDSEGFKNQKNGEIVTADELEIRHRGMTVITFK